VTNAGKLARHVPPTGAPFFGTMGAPLLQPMFSNLTSGSGNSGIGLMANAGMLIEQPCFHTSTRLHP